MVVKVNVSPIMHHFADGRNVVEVDGNNIGECLKQLVAKVPGLEKNLFNKQGELNDYLEIYLNRVLIRPDDTERPVKDGDELHIIPIIDGG